MFETFVVILEGIRKYPFVWLFGLILVLIGTGVFSIIHMSIAEHAIVNLAFGVLIGLWIGTTINWLEKRGW